MRRARVDDNQPIIVKTFRDLGWIVAHTHMVGAGFPDIVCSRSGTTILVEIKDGAKPPSARKLTKPEQEFHQLWQGALHIVESVEEVFELHRCYFVMQAPERYRPDRTSIDDATESEWDQAAKIRSGKVQPKVPRNSQGSL